MICEGGRASGQKWEGTSMFREVKIAVLTAGLLASGAASAATLDFVKER